MSGFIGSTASMFVLSLFIFGTNVTIHELGHFLMAKLFGVGTPIFSFGFGPRWLTLEFKKWKTTWRVTPLLIISYVMMKSGEDEEFDQILETKLGRFFIYCLTPVFFVFSYLIPGNKEDDKTEETQEDEVEQSGLGISEISGWKRFLISAAGPGINLLTAGIVMFVMFFLYGKDAYYMATNNAQGIWTGLDEFLVDGSHSVTSALYNTAVSLSLLSYVFCLATYVMIKMIFTGAMAIHGPVETMEVSTAMLTQVDTSMGGITWPVICGIFVLMAILLATFNLAPIPGLDGCTLVIEPLRLVLPKKLHGYMRFFVRLSGITVIVITMVWAIGSDVFVYFSRFFGHLFS